MLFFVDGGKILILLKLRKGGEFQCPRWGGGVGLVFGQSGGGKGFVGMKGEDGLESCGGPVVGGGKKDTVSCGEGRKGSRSPGRRGKGGLTD